MDLEDAGTTVKLVLHDQDASFTLTLEHERLTGISRLREQHGRWLWRWRAPHSERLALRLAPAAADCPAAEVTASRPHPP